MFWVVVRVDTSARAFGEASGAPRSRAYSLVADLSVSARAVAGTTVIAVGIEVYAVTATTSETVRAIERACSFVAGLAGAANVAARATIVLVFVNVNAAA